MKFINKNTKHKIIENLLSKKLNWTPLGYLSITLPNNKEFIFGKKNSGINASIKLHNYKLFKSFLFKGPLAFADCYISNEFECENLTDLFKFYINNKDQFQGTFLKYFKIFNYNYLRKLLNKNTINRSKKNISLHYDLGNDFFQQWLDETMQYSSAHYNSDHKNLEDAQYSKFQNINNLLGLSKNDSVLEIGCGWGSLSQYLFNENDINIDAITISEKQLEYAKKLSLSPKSNSCSFKLLDYRHTKGLYDKIVSVEMIEAVGIKYLPIYFKTIKNRLKPNGYAIIQAITIGEEGFSNYSRNVDFIQKYIFPGGVLPSVKQLEKETMRNGLEIENINILNDSYEKTLQEWRNKFNNNWENIKEIGYDEKFKRTWNYYLSYCEAGFAGKTINVGLYKIKSI